MSSHVPWQHLTITVTTVYPSHWDHYSYVCVIVLNVDMCSVLYVTCHSGAVLVQFHFHDSAQLPFTPDLWLYCIMSIGSTHTSTSWCSTPLYTRPLALLYHEHWIYTHLHFMVRLVPPRHTLFFFPSNV